MAKPISKQPPRNYQAELIDAVKKVAHVLESKKSDKPTRLNRAADVRALGNAAVIGLVIEQGLRGEFLADRAIAGIVILGLAWFISYLVERGGAD